MVGIFSFHFRSKSLKRPVNVSGLFDCWGEKFEELYSRYEEEGKFIKQVRGSYLFTVLV